MRHGRKYVWVNTVVGPHPGTLFASVTKVSPTSAELHSVAPFPQQCKQLTSFLEALHSYGDYCLWEDLIMDGKGE
jgi:hypothetical protein